VFGDMGAGVAGCEAMVSVCERDGKIFPRVCFFRLKSLRSRTRQECASGGNVGLRAPRWQVSGGGGKSQMPPKVPNFVSLFLAVGSEATRDQRNTNATATQTAKLAYPERRRDEKHIRDFTRLWGGLRLIGGHETAEKKSSAASSLCGRRYCASCLKKTAVRGGRWMVREWGRPCMPCGAECWPPRLPRPAPP